ncbi:MAG: LPP20 family lipoprotein [Treponema sp.]|jgi:hypothetical protein|nr:LPP20 family lipoprotein [Treponema sp.]
MKKTCLVIFGIVCAIMVMSCGSTQPAAAPVATDTPEWLNNFPPEDVLWGIGTAKQSNDSMAMQFAEMRARQSISFQLTAAVKAMLTDYGEDMGATNVTQLQENVGQQLTNTTLTGATPINRWKAPDGTWWYLVQYSKSDAAKLATSFVDNEAARYAEYKTSDALARMNDALATTAKPPVISE